jgi:hypothetical protein
MSKNATDAATRAARAQASIETLVVFLIFLSAFGMVYMASSRLASAAQSRLDTSVSQSYFSEFSAKLQSACSLGSGNVRTVDVKGKPAALSPMPDGNSIIFTAGSFSARANTSCEISSLPLAASSSFAIENKNGKLEVSAAN